LRIIVLVLLFVMFVIPVSAEAALLGNPEKVLLVKYGQGTNEVASSVEDVNRITDGFPPAFAVDARNKIYLLDAGKGRVLTVEKGKISELFSYVTDKMPAVRDITVLRNGNICLANVSTKKVDIYNQSGKKIDEIEGIYPREIISTRDGNLLITNDKTGNIMKFSSKGELIAVVEGTEFFACSENGASVFGSKIDRKEGAVLSAGFKGGLNHIVEFKPPAKNEYICNIRPIGCDIMGNLYVETLFAHDTDEKGEVHEYRMFIYKINIKKQKIVSKIETQAFRGENSHVAPRQYVVEPKGGILTYESHDKEYGLYRYSFK